MTSSTPVPESDPASHSAGQADPVRARRARVAHWTLLANRIGYLILALAVALFILAFVLGFSPTLASLVIALMVISFALLAPSIILGYAVKAAEREDRERGL
jgi:small-conductance mechanosensitive channel